MSCPVLSAMALWGLFACLETSQMRTPLLSRTPTQTPELPSAFSPSSPSPPPQCRYLHAVIVCAFPIQVTAMIVDTAVIQGAETHEAMLEGVVAFLVHVVMPDHILLTRESLMARSRGSGELGLGKRVFGRRCSSGMEHILSMRKVDLRTFNKMLGTEPGTSTCKALAPLLSYGGPLGWKYSHSNDLPL